ncbi:MAG: response regulator transcription factor [Bacteroidota bacterium]
MIKIIIADDHALVRKGLKQFILRDMPDTKITEVDNGNSLLKEVRASIFDLVISDISMPGRSGLESLKQLKEEFPKLPVLILSMHPEEQYALRVLKAGASGYISKDCVPDEIMKAVRQILSGRKYITPSIAERLTDNLGEDFSDKPHEKLSDREFEVLKLIGAGKTISEIGNIISLSPNTISTYRLRILEKMILRTNAELIYYVIANKLI